MTTGFENGTMSDHMSQEEKKEDTEVSVTLFVRNEHKGKEMLSLRVKASTVEQLKMAAVKALTPTSIKEGLCENDIWILAKGTQKVVTIKLDGKEVTETRSNVSFLCPGTQLNEHDAYIALEVFETCPKDMFRTVQPEQLWPATVTHPDYKSEDASFSPLLCAAFQAEKEQQLPFHAHFVEGENVMQISGASLSCDDARSDLPGDYSFPNPYGCIGKEEKAGATTIHATDFEKVVDKLPTTEKCGVGYGWTATTMTHMVTDGGSLIPRKSRIEYSEDQKSNKQMRNINRDRTEKGLAVQRSSYFLYKLSKGVDLSKHGMAVVYDARGAHHCSLVYLGASFAHEQDNRFASLSFEPKYRELVVYFPVPGKLDDIKDMPDDEVRAILAPRSLQQPERFEISIKGQLYCAFPEVASCFTFAGFQMIAGAAPIPLDSFHDDDHRNMCMAGRILFGINQGVEIDNAIFELESKAYVLESTSISCQLTLHQAIKNAIQWDLHLLLDDKQLGQLFFDFGCDEDLLLGETKSEHCLYVLQAACDTFGVVTFEGNPGKEMTTPEKQEPELGAVAVTSPAQDSIASSQEDTNTTTSSVSTLPGNSPTRGFASPRRKTKPSPTIAERNPGAEEDETMVIPRFSGMPFYKQHN